MDRAIQYLKDRIQGVNLNNPKANRGCRLLYHYTDRLPDILNVSWRVIVMVMGRESKDSPHGTAKLMFTAITMGEEVAALLDMGKLYPEDHIKIGVLVLEALMNAEDYVFILRDPSWKGHKLKAPMIITSGSKTPDIEAIPGLELERKYSRMPIPAVSGPIQGNNRTLMKNYGPGKEKAFQRLLKDDPAFIRMVNNLQQTGWMINREVLDLVEPIISQKELMDTKGHERGSADWLLAESHNGKVNSEKALMADALVLRDWDVFYKYVNLDFRGRVYYDYKHFHYQSTDLARGLMLFSEAKPVDKYWLAVHTAASYNASYSIDELPDWCEADYRTFLESQGLTDISVDKMTLNDRVNWTNAHMDELLDYSERILSDGLLGGLPDCEKPISFLACCLEWLKISHDPDYHSRLPIPVDGANNGWQHLGAMSKDTQTGDLVGLVPHEIPYDFYVKTAQKLKEMMPEWFEERQMPMKHIRKGIAKRGSMTKAYSAGAKAIAENMWADVVKEDFHNTYNISEDDCMELSLKLIDAIKDVCPGPLQTMKYLQDLASHELGTTKGTKIQWTTPSGFPVTQEYLLEKEIKMGCTIAPPKGTLFSHPLGKSIKVDGKIVGYNGNINLTGIAYIDGVPKRQKAASAISPNFVHSMDASHMALVVADWEGSFGAVHDSFSTHSCDVEALLQQTKVSFMDMYNTENFFEYMKAAILTHPESFEDNQPELGTLNIQEVENSDFFFA